MRRLVKCSICKKSMDGREALGHVKNTGHNNWELIIKKKDKELCPECSGDGFLVIGTGDQEATDKCPKCQGIGEVRND